MQVVNIWDLYKNTKILFFYLDYQNQEEQRIQIKLKHKTISLIIGFAYLLSHIFACFMCFTANFGQQDANNWAIQNSLDRNNYISIYLVSLQYSV